jgi:predicted metal-dependent HD superfamily phosphohydrolase
MKPFTNTLKILKFRWETLLQPFLVEAELEQKVFLDLVNAYSRPERFYHNLQHINQVLEIIEQMNSRNLDYIPVQLAAWFHDVIYDPQSYDNEEKSAEYAEAALHSLKIPQTIINRVKYLILTTKNHQALPTDIDNQIFLDADLSILGATQWEYQTYAQAIRQEYSWMSDVDYQIGRHQVLNQFLQRERLYLTDYAYINFEKQAKHNLQLEATDLSLKIQISREETDENTSMF